MAEFFMVLFAGALGFIAGVLWRDVLLPSWMEILKLQKRDRG